MKFIKFYSALLCSAVLCSNCSVTRIIPNSSNVDESILMLSPNRDIRANFSVVSEQKDGILPIFDEKERTTTTVKYYYQTETTFKKIWDDYFSTKFNASSQEEMKISINQDNFKVYKKNLSSGGQKFGIAAFGSGSLSFQFEVYSDITTTINYKGKEFKKIFKIKVDEQSQANYYRGYGGSDKNETELVSKMIQKAFNKGIMFTDNFMKTIVPSK